MEHIETDPPSDQESITNHCLQIKLPWLPVTLPIQFGMQAVYTTYGGNII